MAPSEIVTRNLGGEIRVLENFATGQHGLIRSGWSAGIWSTCFGPKFRLISARGETRDQALAALDKKLFDIAKEIVG